MEDSARAIRFAWYGNSQVRRQEATLIWTSEREVLGNVFVCHNLKKVKQDSRAIRKDFQILSPQKPYRSKMITYVTNLWSPTSHEYWTCLETTKKAKVITWSHFDHIRNQSLITHITWILSVSRNSKKGTWSLDHTSITYVTNLRSPTSHEYWTCLETAKKAKVITWSHFDHIRD